MDEEERLGLTARILALEYVLKRVVWGNAVNRADLDGEGEADILRDLQVYAENAEADLRETTTTSSDPAISDHVVALVSENVQRLVDETILLIRKHNPDLQ